MDRKKKILTVDNQRLLSLRRAGDNNLIAEMTNLSHVTVCRCFKGIGSAETQKVVFMALSEIINQRESLKSQFPKSI